MPKSQRNNNNVPHAADRRQENRRRDAEAQLSALLNAAVDGIIIIDNRGTIELFSRAAQRMFGYKDAEVLGQNIKMLMPEPHQGQHDEYLQNYRYGAQARIIGRGREVQGRKQDGEIFPIELSVGEVKKSSHKQFFGIIRDISKQVKIHEDAMENRERLTHMTHRNSMGEMAAGIAHEINQPLSAITSYAHASQNLLEAMTDLNAESNVHQQKILKALHNISDQALRAGEVITRLRAFVKKRKAKLEVVDLNTLIEDTVNLAKVEMPLLNHGIVLELCTQASPLLKVDPVQVQQVLLHLISNAIDAMEDRPNAPVQICTRWLEKNRIEVAVVDVGHGVSEDNRTTLFTPFFSTKKDAMGMGLTISESIINAYGGELRYRRGTSKGSVFAFSLAASLKEKRI
ncbi:MAG: two-component system sensor kinase FixL [Paraglaciecola sp.]|jgi:two-component system sensor kinase FixL